jgi:HEAT repeat protein
MDEDSPDARAIAQRISILARDVHSPDVERRRATAQEMYDICCKTPDLAKSAVPALVHFLCDSDEKVGESALWGLKYCAPESIEPLIECLAHRDAKVRERASHSLGNIGDEAIAACDALRRLIDDSEQEVRKRAMWSLGLIHDTSERTIARLFELAVSPNAAERSSALHALGNIGQALPGPERLRARQAQVLDALNDSDENVRWSAGYVLESLDLEPSEHLLLIMRRLEVDPSSRVREQAVAQLKELDAGAQLVLHLPTMCRVLRNPGREASLICEVLAAMGEKALPAVPALLEALRGDGFVLIEAAKALWKIDGRIAESLPALEKAFEDNPESVCDAVCEIGPAAAPLIPKLLEALKSQDYWDLEWAAADALGHIASDDPAVLSVLASALGHPSPLVRSSAARALARTGTPALPVLLRILGNPDDDRAEWAADTLGRMGNHGAPAADTLRKHLRSNHSGLATWSAIALAKVAGAPEVVPILSKLLCNDRSDLRREAAYGLKAIGPAAQAALPAIRSALEDEDDEVRAAVQEALDAISSPRH